MFEIYLQHADKYKWEKWKQLIIICWMLKFIEKWTLSQDQKIKQKVGRFFMIALEKKKLLEIVRKMCNTSPNKKKTIFKSTLNIICSTYPQIR